MPWARIADTPGDVLLERLISLALGKRVLASCLPGEGAFGITHAVELQGDPSRVVVKWQKRL